MSRNIVGYLYTFDGDSELLMPDEVETGWFEAHPEMYEPVVLMGKVEKQEPVGYQALFDAIAAATSVAYAPGINISIEAFTAKIGPLYPAPQPCPECEKLKA